MNNNIYWGGADHWYCGYCGKGPGHADDCTRPQPTASVDAEQVWREASDAASNAAQMFQPDQRQKRADARKKAATSVIQAYGDARADAVRREALEEAAKVADGYAAAGKDNPQLAPISAQMRYCAQRIRALKENPNAG